MPETAKRNLPTRDLPTLATAANAEHRAAEAAARSALEHARNAGELLLEAKGQVEHGKWTAWIREHVEFAPRTARLYMRIARRWPELEAHTENGNALPIREAAGLLAEPKAKKERDSTPDGIIEDPERWPVPEGHAALMFDPFGRGDRVWVRPADKPGFFWINVIADHGTPDGSGHVEATRRPVHGSALSLQVKVTGFPVEHGTWIDLGPHEGEDYNSLLFPSRQAQLEAEMARLHRRAV